MKRRSRSGGSLTSRVSARGDRVDQRHSGCPAQARPRSPPQRLGDAVVAEIVVMQRRHRRRSGHTGKPSRCHWSISRPAAEQPGAGRRRHVAPALARSARDPATPGWPARADCPSGPRRSPAASIRRTPSDTRRLNTCGSELRIAPLAPTCQITTVGAVASTSFSIRASSSTASCPPIPRFSTATCAVGIAFSSSSCRIAG